MCKKALGEFLFSALFLFFAIVPSGAQQNTELPKRFAITGILQRADGTAATGEKVYLAYVTAQGTFVRLGMVDGSIQPANPSGKVSKTGRFRIEFDEDFLKDTLDNLRTNRFTLGTMVNGQFEAISHPDAKVGIFFELPDILGKESVRDLGTITLTK